MFCVINVYKNFAPTRRIFLPVETLSLLPCHRPAIMQGYPIQPFCSALLDAHRGPQLHPACRIGAGDADRLVGGEARDSAYVLDVPLSVILIWRRPATDYRPDGE